MRKCSNACARWMIAGAVAAQWLIGGRFFWMLRAMLCWVQMGAASVVQLHHSQMTNVSDSPYNFWRTSFETTNGLSLVPCDTRHKATLYPKKGLTGNLRKPA